ncbi:hypothetical protein [Micromonospora sp. NPDC049891]|uniref:hypothetical protein n=1 Tax=Micromonospora sp. NPDC049891 TaxID=3155655 RepID=UPI0033CEBE2F
MAALTITAARAEVLRAAANEQLHSQRQFSNKRSNEKTTHRIGGPSGRNVTRISNDLYNAHLIRPGRKLGPSIYSPQVWELTDAGRQALADHDATERS